MHACSCESAAAIGACFLPCHLQGICSDPPWIPVLAETCIVSLPVTVPMLVPLALYQPRVVHTAERLEAASNYIASEETQFVKTISK